MVLVIGAGSAAGFYLVGNPWPMSVIVGVVAAALSWVALRMISSEL